MTSAMSLWLCIVTALLLVGQLAIAHAFNYHMIGKFEVGQSLVISGTTRPNATGFWITLADVSDNYPLQVSVNFPKGYIRRSTRENDSGYTEENEHLINASVAYNPIVAGELFKITIFVGYDGYMVAINGSPYCQYEHRLPLTSIVELAVNGDWQTLRQVDHRTAYPVPWPPLQLDTDDEAADFVHTFPRAYRAGHRIDIKAVPHSADGGGHFVLRLDDENDGNCDCAFGGPDGRNLTRSSSSGEQGELLAEFPFSVGRQFGLTLEFKASGALVFRVDGKEIGSYKSAERIGFGWLRGLRIEGRDGMRVQVTLVQHSQD